MTKIPFLLTLLVALLVCLLPIAPAQAQAPRTFVSAAGSDSNPCSFAAPCRHFQAAVNATSAGGEVDALDPAGYGPIFITKSITIEGQGWSYIAPPFGGDGISINAPGDRVAIHGVSINGVGITPAFGIVFNSGSSLKVQDCVLQNFSGTGILFQPNGSSKISVANTRVSDSNFGIAISPTGTGTTNGVLNHVDIENNIQDGITVSTSSQGLNVTITDSVSAQNGGDGVKMAANLVRFTCETPVSSTMAIMEWKQQAAIIQVLFFLRDQRLRAMARHIPRERHTCSAMATIVSARTKLGGTSTHRPPCRSNSDEIKMAGAKATAEPRRLSTLVRLAEQAGRAFGHIVAECSMSATSRRTRRLIKIAPACSPHAAKLMGHSNGSYHHRLGSSARVRRHAANHIRTSSGSPHLRLGGRQ